MNPLDVLAGELAAGTTSGVALAEQCLDAIANPGGEGARAFVQVDRQGVLRHAALCDALRAGGAAPPRFAGIPLGVKDLFDVAGEVTRAGSKILADAAPAKRDADCIARLRAAGFVLIGRTNMVEFAFGGIGTNAHYGTPMSVWDRETGRVPGGSSSGSAVAVADGMAAIALGTDTGGSCRIPAAFNAVTGYKPTSARVSRRGVYPLSETLDSVGPIGRTVRCCAAVDAIMAGDWDGTVAERPLTGLRLAILQTLVLDDMDETVARTFEQALARLAKAGACCTELALPVLGDIADLQLKGSIVNAEAFHVHRNNLAQRGKDYDPKVVLRLGMGETMSAVDYLDVCATRRRIMAEVRGVTRDFDALIMPTCPVVPPRIADVSEDDAYLRTNALCLRNTALGNFLDVCAISLPVSAPGEAPVGLMVFGETGADQALFRTAAAIERALVQH